jgi:phosphate transport system substrate-binding protein
MKQYSIFLMLGAIALLPLTSCTTAQPNNSLSSTAPTASQSTVNQTELKITGASTSYAGMEMIADAFQAQQPDIKITLLPPSQSSGGIAAVKDGLVEIGSVTRPPKPEEDNGQLEYREIAQDGLLVATHPSVTGVTNLTKADLQKIYSGAASNWKDFGGPDAMIIVLDRPEDESAKQLLRKHYLGEKLPNAPKAVILRHETDLVTAIQNTPHSIGAFSLANAIHHQLPVNRLSLDGVEPTPENVRLGEYKMVRLLGLAWKKSPSSEIQALIDFASSPATAQILEQAGFVPANAAN